MRRQGQVALYLPVRQVSVESGRTAVFVTHSADEAL